MDGLSALGLAANILQFLDFSARLLSEANEVYHSATGLSNEHDNAQDIAQSLSRLAEGLAAPVTGSASGLLDDVSNEDAEISRMASSAKAVADELIAATRSVPACHKKRWRSFRQALDNAWNKGKVQGLQTQLNSLRSRLSAHILARISKLQTSLVLDLSTLKTSFEQLQSGRKDDLNEILGLLRGLKGLPQVLEHAHLKQVQQAFKEAETSLRSYCKEREVLESLLFETMRYRYEAIPEAHQQTFRWIFEPSKYPSSDPRSKIQFKEWLKSGCGLYWISGKPGSGKSTLMKYICDHPLTIEYLRQWAGSDRLIMASFFFWGAGTEMQRCRRGLLQQLLFEILRACPQLIPILCTERWCKSTIGSWSLRELQNAFERLGNIASPIRICFFIDGLDEYEDRDGEIELISALQQMSSLPHIKLCVSSRPWPCFEDAFGSNEEAKLYLHHLTVDDIRGFVRDKLQALPESRYSKKETQDFERLITEITRRAQGVFLWVFLVVKRLRSGLTKGDNLKLLLQRLEEMPDELGPFFDQLLRSIESIYHPQLAVTFEVAIRAPEPMCILSYWFLEEDNHYTSQDRSNRDFSHIVELEERMSRNLNCRYNGLLEATGVPGARKVNFIHGTVREHLQRNPLHRQFARGPLLAATKAAKALAAHAEYCSRIKGGRGFNSQDFAYFIIFACWATEESRDFDWTLFQKVESHMAGQVEAYDSYILIKAVQYGFTAYLQHRLDQDHTIVHQFSKHLLRAALEIQGRKANSAFGVQSSYETLSWLLRHGADPNIRTSIGTLFTEFLSEFGAIARRSKVPWAYEQWKGSLALLIRYGARFNDIFDDPRFVEALPQIGMIKHAGIHNIASIEQGRVKPMLEGLHRHLDIYEVFLEHKLDPNRRIFSFTLWEMWLWYVCKWQSDHGYLEAICIRAMKMFLTHGADPFLSIRFFSDRIAGSSMWSVSDIVHTFLTEESRVEILPVLESAKRRWRETHPLLMSTAARKQSVGQVEVSDRAYHRVNARCGFN